MLLERSLVLPVLTVDARRSEHLVELIEALPSFLSELGDPIRRIRATARALGVSTRSLYLAFARDCLPGTLPVIGCETNAQLEEVLDDWTAAELDVGGAQQRAEQQEITHGFSRKTDKCLC